MALGFAAAAGAVAADEPKLLATRGKANHPYSRNAVFSPDGRTLATCGNGDLTLYDPATHQVIATLEIERGGNERLAYSPDGMRIATTQGEDGEATVYDPTNLKGPVLTLTPPKAKRTPQDVRRVAYSLDGKHIVLGRDGADLEVWDAVTGKPLSVLKGHSIHITGVAFAPEGNLMASEDPEGTVLLWDPANWKQVAKLTAVGVKKAGTTLGDFLRFSSDGKLLCAAGPGCMAVQVWDVAAKKMVAEVQGPEETLGGVTFRRQVTCAAFSADGKHLAVGCDAGTILMWDVVARKLVSRFEAPADDRRRVRISSVAFSPDGRALAAGTNHHQVQLWDLPPSK